MKKIYQNKIVKGELKKLQAMVMDYDDRDVDYDITLLKTALNEINAILEDGATKVIVGSNMWDECLFALDRIVKEFNLKINSETGTDYEWIVHV